MLSVKNLSISFKSNQRENTVVHGVSFNLKEQQILGIVGESGSGKSVTALAVLGLLGKRVPLSMRIFLTALAVVDDIGGIIIIALFYSGEIAFEPLLISLALLALLYVGGRMRVNNIAFYYIIGFFVWMLFLESGIHPTIAGVLVAFTVPARPVVKLDDFTCEMTGYLDMLDYTEVRHSRKAAVLSSTQIQVLNNIHSLADKTISPLQSIANKLHPLVNYLILPLFAFVNAGVTFGDIGIGSLLGIPLAVFFGLFAGKSLGIFLFTYIFVRLRLATMPEGVSKRNLFGVSMLGGIGFTVALFIANLSFAGMPDVGVELLNQAKLGVFAGSFISGLCGYLILKKVFNKVGNYLSKQAEYKNAPKRLLSDTERFIKIFNNMNVGENTARGARRAELLKEVYNLSTKQDGNKLIISARKRRSDSGSRKKTGKRPYVSNRSWKSQKGEQLAKDMAKSFDVDSLFNDALNMDFDF